MVDGRVSTEAGGTPRQSTDNVYKFRNCVVDTFERTLSINGVAFVLTTRTFDVLEYLVRNAGRVITKDELLANAWHGQFVEECNLAVQISKIRAALYETANNRFIETVTGTGYRFLARVNVEDSDIEIPVREAA